MFVMFHIFVENSESDEILTPSWPITNPAMHCHTSNSQGTTHLITTLPIPQIQSPQGEEGGKALDLRKMATEL